MREAVKVKPVSEREIWVGETRYYLGEDNTLYVTEIGECDEKTAIEEKEAGLKLMKMVEGKVNFLVDLNQCGKQSPGARKIRKESIEIERVGKFALFGLHPVARVLASFVMGVTKKKDMRFFKTKEEALAWLKA